MINSKIGICNLALAAIGEDSIRDFADGNKRARMCDVFYDTSRDYILSQFNWPFARKQLALNKLATSSNWIPEGMIAYALPVDCHQPIDILPEGSMQSWEVLGRELYTRLDSEKYDVVLRYTKYEIDPTKFSAQFYNLLSLAIAVRICIPLTQDKALAKEIFSQYKIESTEAWGVDANIGNKHLHNDNNPALDSFVDPDFSFTQPVGFE